MTYSAIASRRMPYDVDGTVVGYGITGFNDGISTWLSSEQLGALNSQDLSGVLVHNSLYSTKFYEIRMFFPERREIELVSIAFTAWDSPVVSIKGSNDTTNGVDGIWETATFPSGAPVKDNTSKYWWRTGILPLSFSTSYKVICISIPIYYRRDETCYIHGIHLYGRKAAGETSDDIFLCDTNGAELTALMEWGDRPEGTTIIKSFKVKNSSTTKMANNINLQLNHADYGLSFSENGPWTATLDITSIAANSLSATIYARNLLGPPLLTLGPKAARVIVTTGSFT